MHIFTVMVTGLAYLLYLVYDWCSVKKPGLRAARLLFPLGTALIACATVLFLYQSLPAFRLTGFSALCLALAAVSGWLLLDALVFSLPKNTYTEPGAPRLTCRSRMYALCRHPGVLWYCCLYGALWLAMPTRNGALQCAVLCAGDLIYMLVQDIWTFPAIFADYDHYKTATPLLLPNRASIRACCRDYFH